MREDGKNNRKKAEQTAGKSTQKPAGDNNIPGSIELGCVRSAGERAEIQRHGEDGMEKNPEQYGGIYKELAELLGDAAVVRIWKSYAGLSVTFPMKLYSKEYIHEFIKEHCGDMKPSEIGRVLGLSERRVRQLIHELRAETDQDTEKTQSIRRKSESGEE